MDCLQMGFTNGIRSRNIGIKNCCIVLPTELMFVCVCVLYIKRMKSKSSVILRRACWWMVTDPFRRNLVPSSSESISPAERQLPDAASLQQYRCEHPKPLTFLKLWCAATCNPLLFRYVRNYECVSEARGQSALSTTRVALLRPHFPSWYSRYAQTHVWVVPVAQIRPLRTPRWRGGSPKRTRY